MKPSEIPTLRVALEIRQDEISKYTQAPFVNRIIRVARSDCHLPLGGRLFDIITPKSVNL